MKVLPLAIILTLAIETWGVIVYGKVEEKVKAFVIVTFANIASFIAPYVYSTFRLNRFYCSGWSYAWERAFNNGPNHIIRLAYLMLTLCIEVPLVYFLLKNRSNNKKRLLLITIAVNVITTIVVAVLERLLCQGRW
jgi:heme/copper-type cytochrome/quinol oxidase subunit 4